MRVPVYERRVGIQPMPQPNIQPVMSTSGRDAAAVQAAHGVGIAKSVQDFADRLIKLQQDHEDAQTLEAFNQFKQDSLNYHEDPDKGLYNTRLGGSSQGVYNDADKWMREKGEDYAMRLGSNRAKANFRRMASDYILARGQTNSRFEADQGRKYRIETADASIKNDLAEIEANWNNPEAINQARIRIQQALELKLRGSSRDAYNAAYAEIEDQIGIARLRQAFVKDPLLAVSMLDDKDIHLKPDTAAKLREKLTNKTEIYELQAIAQTFAGRYTVENSVQAYNDLIRMYGADKGNKAYAQLSRIWGIAQHQRTAREQNTLDAQRRNANEFIIRFNDPNKPQPTEQEIIAAQNNNSIRPEDAHTFLNYIKTRQNEAARTEHNRRQAEKDNETTRIWARTFNKDFPTDEELTQLVQAQKIDRSTANWVRGEREKYNREQEQAKTDALKNQQAETDRQFFLRTISPDADTLTYIDVEEAVKNKTLTVSRAQHYYDFINKRDENNEKGKRKAFESILLAFAQDKHMFLPRERLRELQRQNRISDEFAEKYANKEEQYNNARESELARIQRDKDKQAQDAAKAQAKTDQQQREQSIFEFVRDQLLTAYPAGQEGDGFKAIDQLYKNREDRDIAHKYYSQGIQDQKTAQQSRDKAAEKINEQLYNNMLIAAWNGQWDEMSPDRLNELAATGALKKEQRNELERIRAEQIRAREKAEQELHKDQLYQDAQDLHTRFGIDHEGDAYAEIREKYSRADAKLVTQYYDRLIQEDRTVRTAQEKAKREQQKNTFTGLYRDYWNNAKPVPNVILRQLETNDGLTREQLDRAHALNAALSTRAGIESSFMADPNINWASLSRSEREKMIMTRMGTSEEQRKENVTYLFSRVLDGSATDELIDWYYHNGRIAADDRERLKGYDTKFVKEQRQKISQTLSQIQSQITALGIKDSNLRKNLQNEAILNYTISTSSLEPHDKNFDKNLQDIYQAIMSNIIAQCEDKLNLTQGWIWKSPTPQGIRLNNVIDSVNSYNIPVYNPQILYENSNLQRMLINPEGVSADFTNESNVQLPQPYVPQAQRQPAQPASQRDPLQDNRVNRDLVVPSNPRNFNSDLLRNTPIIPNNTPRAPQPPMPPNPLLQRMSNPDNYSRTPFSRLQRVSNPQNLPTLTGEVDFSSAFFDGNFAVTSGYTLSPTAIRNGRSHQAIDRAVPNNTPLRVPNGYTWTVSKTGSNSTAGKHVTISTQLNNGDNISVTFAHLSSYDVRRGETINPGDIFARTGNSGHSVGKNGGYHLHTSVKINGQTVNPLRVNLDATAPVNPEIIDYSRYAETGTTPPPQPLVPPVAPLVSTDQEMYQAVIETLGMGGNALWDISGDIETRFFGGY